MAEREDLIDTIAGFALFADTPGPRWRRSSTSSRRPSSRRARRSSARASPGPASTSSSMARPRSSSMARSAPGWAAASSSARSRSLLGETPIADVVATRPLRCLVLPGPSVEALPDRQPAGDVPDAPGAGPPAAGREPMAELSAPFPPGDYPVLVVGSGPGALQVSYSLSPPGRRSRGHLGRPVGRAGCSGAGRSSSGCCRGPSRMRRPSAGRAPTSATTGTACSAPTRSARRSSRG